MTTIHYIEHIKILGILTSNIVYGYTIRKGGISYFVRIEPLYTEDKEKQRNIYLSQGFLHHANVTLVQDLLDKMRDNMKIGR
jgi:hypothetical protein